MGRYVKNAGAIFSLKLHLVWCPKYRRKVLVGDVDARLRQLLSQKADQLEVGILAIEIMPDHVHLFVEHPPVISVAEIVNGLKGYTSHTLRSEFPHLRSRIPTLWSRSYYAGSVGHVSESVVLKYIENQKGK
jgi:putative transposase